MTDNSARLIYNTIQLLKIYYELVFCRDQFLVHLFLALICFMAKHYKVQAIKS